MDIPLSALPGKIISLAAKSREEEFVEVLDRLGTNAKYRCPFCSHTFSGGNQKIRVHITGVKEGGSSVKACSNPDPDALAYCAAPRATQKRKVGTEERAQTKKLARLAEVDKQSTVFKEAWEILHTQSKLRDANSTVEARPATASVPAILATTQIQEVLDEFGVEKCEDFIHLESKHFLRLADFLKVVPRKVFLELLRVAVATAPEHAQH